MWKMMACGGCTQRRVDLSEALKAAASGDMQAAAAKIGTVGRTFSEDAAVQIRSAGQKLAAAHARLKR